MRDASIWIALTLVGVVAPSCAQPAEVSHAAHPRDRLFAPAGNFPLSMKLAEPARWRLIFHPDLGECRPNQAAVLRAVHAVAEEFSDLEVFTVLPRSGGHVKEIFGVPLAGETLVVSNQAYELENRIAPRPRIEVWAGDGRLLLLRSVPSVVDEEGLVAEIRWARAFTAPLGEGGS